MKESVRPTSRHRQDLHGFCRKDCSVSQHSHSLQWSTLWEVCKNTAWQYYWYHYFIPILENRLQCRGGEGGGGLQTIGVVSKLVDVEAVQAFSQTRHCPWNFATGTILGSKNLILFELQKPRRCPEFTAKSTQDFSFQIKRNSIRLKTTNETNSGFEQCWGWYVFIHAVVNITKNVPWHGHFMFPIILHTHLLFWIVSCSYS